jgi:hypothetical protein
MPQSQAKRSGRPVMLPPGMKRQAHCLPAMQANCPSRASVHCGGSCAARGQESNKKAASRILRMKQPHR